MTSDKPLRQRNYRAYEPARPAPHAARDAAHLARLARRLTPRDYWLAHQLHEQRVLTSATITDLCFPSASAARQRLYKLTSWAVVDRFQPFLPHGSAPMHYVLGPAGAVILAHSHGIDVKELRYNNTRQMSIASSLRLAHFTGTSGYFGRLVKYSRTAGHGTAVTAWWSEARCGRLFGDITRPDGYGRWRHGGRSVEWFLEYDADTMDLAAVAAKLTGYAALADASRIATPVLFYFPTPAREASARKHLHIAWAGLPDPGAVPVATTSHDAAITHGPAGPIWLPLDTPTARPLSLDQLPQRWPRAQVPDLAMPPTPATTGPASAGPLPAPPPMAPGV